MIHQMSHFSHSERIHLFRCVFVLACSSHGQDSFIDRRPLSCYLITFITDCNLISHSFYLRKIYICYSNGDSELQERLATVIVTLMKVLYWLTNLYWFNRYIASPTIINMLQNYLDEEYKKNIVSKT